MKILKTLLALSGVLLFLGAGTARAQTKIEIGPRVGYEFDTFDAFVLGAEGRISAAGFPIVINPTFGWFFLDDQDFGDTNVFQVNINGLYEFNVNNQLFVPYFGAGLALTRVSVSSDTVFGQFDASNTETGLNILAGAKFGFGGAHPFIQVQTVVGGNAETSTVAGGVLFDIGG